MCEEIWNLKKAHSNQLSGFFSFKDSGGITLF